MAASLRGHAVRRQSQYEKEHHERQTDGGPCSMQSPEPELISHRGSVVGKPSTNDRPRSSALAS
jgi:hypothetical protein